MKFLVSWAPPILAGAVLYGVLETVQAYLGTAAAISLAVATFIAAGWTLISRNSKKTQPAQDREDWKP